MRSKKLHYDSSRGRAPALGIGKGCPARFALLLTCRKFLRVRKLLQPNHVDRKQLSEWLIAIAISVTGSGRSEAWPAAFASSTSRGYNSSFTNALNLPRLSFK